MALEWSVVKYVADVWRNEPKNVGIIVRGESAVQIRFFAESEVEPGKIDGRTARKRTADIESYREWVAYFRRKAGSGSWEEILASQRRRPDFPYFVSVGGSLPSTDDSGILQMTNELYRDLVAEIENIPSDIDADSVSDRPQDRMRRIFNLAHLDVVERISVPGLFNTSKQAAGVRRELRFEFGHKNGRQHLFDPVASKSSLYDYYARAEAAHNADPSANLLAFYPGSRFRNSEDEIRVMEAFGSAIDLEDEKSASQQVVEVVRRGGG